MAECAETVPARTAILTPSEALAPNPSRPAPDCFVVSASLGRIPDAGLRLVADMRARDGTRHAAIALALHDPDTSRAAMALDLGANDLLTLPWDPEETALRLTLHVARKRRADRLRRAVDEGLRLSVIDPLTGLYNRRFGLAHLDRLCSRTKAEGRTLAVMVLDLDRFKAINDTYGHAVGDAVLEGVAASLSDALRPSDLLARIGGEEFMIVLPDTSLSDAMRVAQRLCRAVAATRIAAAGQEQAISVTASVGLALDDCARERGARDQAGGRRLLNAADGALLAAKAEGRNQVTVASAA